MSDTTTLSSEEFTTWLERLPLKDRKEKIQRIISDANVSKRTIDNWRIGRPAYIDKKYVPIIRKIMQGGDKIGIELLPATFKGYQKLAEARGMTVSQYLGELLKMFGAIVLLACLGHQILHPSDSQARRFGRRRSDSVCLAEMESDA